ncbi:MAG TPA: response regulator transcription factor [Candidatus Caccomorpha excrementavium]|nr:response regulator transcription factor [Candidatus Caccomorpha excrementavium]
MQNIYCVEDDQNIRDLVVYALGTAGFGAKGFEKSSELYEEMKKELPVLILLDIMLPEDDGMQILRHIRSDMTTRNIPVIMLTAKSAEFDKVMGLDSGADDYITKPFGVMEMISRVKAVLRRAGSVSEETRLVLGGIILDAESHVVTVNGERVAFTYKEFELLQYLMKNEGIVLTRDKLMSAVWGFDFEGESRTVDMHIKTLRQKLGSCGSMIETVRGVGYKICNNG